MNQNITLIGGGIYFRKYKDLEEVLPLGITQLKFQMKHWRFLMMNIWVDTLLK